MSMEYLNIGCSPTDEKCVQVGAENYEQNSLIECRIFKQQLERSFPSPEGSSAHLAIKSFPHDFGSYREVVAKFDLDDEAGCNWAYEIENNHPPFWDEISKRQLKEVGLL